MKRILQARAGVMGVRAFWRVCVCVCVCACAFSPSSRLMKARAQFKIKKLCPNSNENIITPMRILQNPFLSDG